MPPLSPSFYYLRRKIMERGYGHTSGNNSIGNTPPRPWERGHPCPHLITRERGLLLMIHGLEDVLRTHLGDMEKPGIVRDLLKFRNHQFGVGKGIVLEINLDLE